MYLGNYLSRNLPTLLISTQQSPLNLALENSLSWVSETISTKVLTSKPRLGFFLQFIQIFVPPHLRVMNPHLGRLNWVFPAIPPKSSTRQIVSKTFSKVPKSHINSNRRMCNDHYNIF